jgi:hypothetical protein
MQAHLVRQPTRLPGLKGPLFISCSLVVHFSFLLLLFNYFFKNRALHVLY